jgi:peptidoglycan hydrolase-like protein with peptidoglycan-binding domain
VPLKVDGVFDEKTEKCVIKFQRYKEKTENGVVSERTWTLMLNQAESIVSEDIKKQRSISINDPKVAVG